MHRELGEQEASRRRFLKAGLAGLASSVWAEERVQLPFDNGERPLVKYPQKRPLIRHTARPPQLETPFSVYQESLLTPNDAFFVRYHLAGSPPPQSVLSPENFRLQVRGTVQTPQTWSLEALKEKFESVEVVAVNQCSGNSRGFFQPRIPGGQSGHGNMGCARWRGVRLVDVLKASNLLPQSKQVLFDGLDRPLVAGIPDFVKALEVEKALDPDVLLAWEMNGEPLPWLNGYPLRLVVPGHYGTYWVKHLHSIQIVDATFTGFWMNPAYRIPDDPCAHVAPGTTPKRTVPIDRFNVRSFLTSHQAGDRIQHSGEGVTLRGIAFDGGSGIRDVTVSTDGGKHWTSALLGKDLGRYAFREWTLDWRPSVGGTSEILVRATNRLGQSQPLDPLWNPAGYMRNIVERTVLSL
jgi:DMSO/TMAO reductase YedYZ molybdopterin-dependent catalytic subunit